MKDSTINTEFINKLFQVKISEIRDRLNKEFQVLDSDNIQNKLYHQSFGYIRVINLVIEQTKKKSELLLAAIFEGYKGNSIDLKIKKYINKEISRLIDREISEKQNFLDDRLHASRFPDNTIKTFSRNLLINAEILKGDLLNKIFVEVEIHNEVIRSKSNVKSSEKKQLVVPDLQWYLDKSRKLNQLPRCPFASVEECPRFYQSLSLLGEFGSTSIPPEKDTELLEKWKKSPYWPVVPEQATSITGSDENHVYSLFCPEVSYERFKLFATVLIEYGDAEEKEKYIEQLNNDNKLAGSMDWRLHWAFIEPNHYSACSLFSLLSKRKIESKPYHEDFVDVKPNIFGLGLNFNALWHKIRFKIFNK
jgi:hypothetical protein